MLFSGGDFRTSNLLLVPLFLPSDINLNRKPTSLLTKAGWNVISSQNTGSAQAARTDPSL